MNRIIIKTYENNNLLFTNTTTGLLDNNYLSFNIDNDSIQINLKDFCFTKKNSEHFFKLTKDNCYLKVNNIDSIDIPIEYVNFFYEDTKIILEYKLITQENPLKIEIEIGSVSDES